MSQEDASTIPASGTISANKRKPCDLPVFSQLVMSLIKDPIPCCRMEHLLSKG